MRGVDAAGARSLLRATVAAATLVVLMAAVGQVAAAARAHSPAMVGLALAADPAELIVEAVPSEASPANRTIVLRVANVGGGSVRSVRIGVDSPPGVSVMIEPSAIARLAAGSSTLALVTVRGFPGIGPAALVMRATGRSDAGEIAAVTSVHLVPPEPIASLSLVGNTRLTDVSPADLLAVVGNSAEVPINVLVRATAGQQTVRLAREGKDVAKSAPDAPLAMTVPPRQSATVLVRVEAHHPLRRGTVGLVVVAAIRTNVSPQSSDVTASRQLDVALSADVLPGMIGVGSVLIIPGIVAIWAFLTVWYLDRRRLGLAVRSVGSQIWDNKLWLLAAGVVSLLAAVIYSAAGFADLLDSYALSDITVVTAAAGLLGALASAVMVWLHRYQLPAITPTSTEFSVLKAASHKKFSLLKANRKNKKPAGLFRQVYRTPGGKRGLFVHKDWGALVLTPPIEYTRIGSMPEAEDENSLQSAVEIIGTAREDRIRFLRRKDNDYIDGPCAVLEATPCGSEIILRFVDTF